MNTTVRDGRRRRILHEGASSLGNPDASAGEPATRARYTPRVGSASFAVAAAVLPRSPLAVLATLFVLGGAIGLLAWVDHFGVAISGAGPLAAAKRLLLIDTPGSLALWWEAVLWVAVAAQAVLLFGMRKHRTDDTRGAYRWWLAVAGVAMGTSLATATTTTTVVASQLAAATGFSPLAGDAFWWLVPGALATTVIAVRSFLEVKESPLAAAAGVAATLALALGGFAGAGLLPSGIASLWSGFASPLVGPIAGMAGASLTLVSLLLYARRIALEALGEVAPPQPAAKPSKKGKEESQQQEEVQERPAPKPAPAPLKAVKPAPRPEPAVLADERDEAEHEEEEQFVIESPAARRAKKRREREAAKAKAAEQSSEETQWVSGPEADEDYDDGPQRRKLSKAERKRLRREKARRAA